MITLCGTRCIRLDFLRDYQNKFVFNLYLTYCYLVTRWWIPSLIFTDTAITETRLGAYYIVLGPATDADDGRHEHRYTVRRNNLYRYAVTVSCWRFNFRASSVRIVPHALRVVFRLVKTCSKNVPLWASVFNGEFEGKALPPSWNFGFWGPLNCSIEIKFNRKMHSLNLLVKLYNYDRMTKVIIKTGATRSNTTKT